MQLRQGIFMLTDSRLLKRIYIFNDEKTERVENERGGMQQRFLQYILEVEHNSSNVKYLCLIGNMNFSNDRIVKCYMRIFWQALKPKWDNISSVYYISITFACSLPW